METTTSTQGIKNLSRTKPHRLPKPRQPCHYGELQPSGKSRGKFMLSFFFLFFSIFLKSCIQHYLHEHADGDSLVLLEYMTL